MAEYLAPEVFLQSTDFVGAVSVIQNSPDDIVDLNWLTASTTAAAPSFRVSFPTPTVPLSGMQEFRVKVKKRGGTGTPTATLALWENGVQITQSNPFNVTSILGQTISWTWNSSGRNSASIELRLTTTNPGGIVAVRATVDVAAVRWSAAGSSPGTSIADQIQNILNNNEISLPERKRNVQTLKSQKIVETLPSTISDSTLAITFVKPPVVRDNGNLELWVSATRDGTPINIPTSAQPFIFVNPPMFNNGIEDPLAAARQIITDAVSRFG